MYDLLIVGGGPGGVAAGVYAARKKINAILITDSFGGQSLVSNDIQNWVGTKLISGLKLAEQLEEHLRAQEGIEVADGDLILRVEKLPAGQFKATTQSGRTIETRFILVATGSRRRKLGVPGEKELDGKGVVYCSTCDAPLFGGKTIAVVGGGNAGLEAVLDSLPYASKIYLLERSGVLKGDAVTQEKIKANPKAEIMLNAETLSILGEGFVTGLQYRDTARGTEGELQLDGVFIEIGALPNSDFVKGIVNLNPLGEIVVDHRTQQTSDPGIWAIGDVSDVLYKQNNISAGDAVKAVLNIYERISKG
jgi:NADH-dependent peroxiredoxin subunit F